LTVVGAPEIKVRRRSGVDQRRPLQLPAVLRIFVHRPRECAVTLAATTAIAAIVINGLFLQPGPHPAPIFAITPSAAAAVAGNAVAPVRPRTPVAEIMRSDPAARPRAEIIADIQRELARHGFYDGPIDGAHGAKTVAAIRDFEQSAGLKPTGEASEAMLQAIAKAPVATRSTTPRKDPIAGLIARRAN
jgi:hypothetical protein